ncbi:MAG TPA: hypothetical protein VIQ29_04350 [Ancylobacter sp.]
MTKQQRPATRTIEVFRPGTYVSMGGESLTYSADDLRAVASSYDAAGAPAPIVIGHPATDAPAFGWAKSFAFDEASQRLTAEIDQIEPAFADAVTAGRYKKVSLSFFRPSDAANPAPGTWYPKHVGFLGAAPPAVTGLKVVQFGAAADAVTIEFAAGARQAAGLFRRMREFLIEQFSLEAADRVLPDYEIRWLDEEGREPAPEPLPAFAAPIPEEPNMTQPKPAAVVQPPVDFAARETSLTAREAAIAERERGIVHDSHVAFAAELVGAGRILPAHEKRFVLVLDAIGGAATPVSFAAGEPAISPVDHLKNMLRELPQVVPLGGTLPDERAAGDAPSFAAPDHRNVDGDRLATHAKAVAWQAQHPGSSYLDAVRAVDPNA